MAAADMAVKMGQPAAAVTEYDTMCFWVEDGSVRLAMLPFTTVAILPSLLATYSLTVPLLATDQLELELTFTSVLFSTHSLLLEYLLPATDYFVLLYTFSLYSHTLCWVEGLVSGAFDGSRVTPSPHCLLAPFSSRCRRCLPMCRRRSSESETRHGSCLTTSTVSDPDCPLPTPNALVRPTYVRYYTLDV